jgi:phosphatidylglycerophosphate synthase
VLDTALRARLAPGLDGAGRRLGSAGVSAGAVTAVGLVVGIAACVAAALEAWPVALVLWLINRALDGLDGAVARASGGGSDLGGLLDFVADFVVYGGFVVGVGIAEPDARIACTALLAAYLLNNVALLSFAALVEKRRLDFGDERSLRFTPGLTEGTETILAYVVFCLVPSRAEIVAWVFAAMVLFTVGQRVQLAVRTLT